MEVLKNKKGLTPKEKKDLKKRLLSTKQKAIEDNNNEILKR